MDMDNYKVVVASVRPADLLKWVKAWGWDPYKLIIVEDNLQKSDLGMNLPYHFSHSEIDLILGDDSWVIPRKTSAIKSFGIYQAFRQGADWIIVLDDDCYPVNGVEAFVSNHFRNLSFRADLDWVKTGSQYTRGYPYMVRNKSEIVLSHGLWNLYPDYDAITSLAQSNLPFVGINQIIPRWAFFPMCGMNIAFKPEVAPLMYFGLQGRDYPYDRFDDIWCGIFAKKIIDHLGFAVISGNPAIKHIKLSDPFVNLRKEAPGIEENESIWLAVKSVDLSEKEVILTALELFKKLPLNSDYWKKYRRAALTWLRLFVQN